MQAKLKRPLFRFWQPYIRLHFDPQEAEILESLCLTDYFRRVGWEPEHIARGRLNVLGSLEQDYRTVSLDLDAAFGLVTQLSMSMNPAATDEEKAVALDLSNLISKRLAEVRYASQSPEAKGPLPRRRAGRQPGDLGRQGNRRRRA